jgi:hypothetical protein
MDISIRVWECPENIPATPFSHGPLLGEASPGSREEAEDLIGCDAGSWGHRVGATRE